MPILQEYYSLTSLVEVIIFNNLRDNTTNNNENENSEKIENNDSNYNENENKNNSEHLINNGEEDNKNSYNNENSEVTNKEDKINKTVTQENKNIENKEKQESCSNEKILNNKCKENINNKQITEIYDYLEDKLINEGYEEKKEVYTGNTVYQVSTIKEQKNNDNLNISTIDFGECENKLKKYYNISDENELIFIKLDIKYNDTTYVQYEVYHPITNKKLNLSVCENLKIFIDLPVILNIDIQSLYDRLDKSGYNLFDLNDSFYTDMCTPYTSENGTDITLNDRKNFIYGQAANLSFCQTGCQFRSYNATTNRVKCHCNTDVENIKTMLTNFTFAKNQIISNFYSTIKNSNFKVVKCYKLLYNIEDLVNNIGCIIMTIIYLLLFTFFFVFCFTGGKNFDYFIQLLIINKINSEKNNIIKNNSNSTNHLLKINKKKFQKFKNKINNKKDNELIKEIKIKKCKKPKIIKDNNNNFPPKKLKINILSKSSLSSNPNSNSKIFVNKLNENSYADINKLNIIKNKKESNPNYNINIYKSNFNINSKKIINKNQKTNTIFELDLSNNERYKYLNDYELNNLDYKDALELDKRTYYQYYWSLLKRKQLILFSFLPNNDYNLRIIKITLFFLSFSLYFTINGFFFTDDTMHKLYEDNGEYNIIYQLPQILYSSIITAAINFILQLLSLSETSILSLKKEKNYLLTCSKAKYIKSCLISRIIIFYFLSFIIMFFFWLFISCFCVVYINTQIILIIDTFISFTLSMIYPIGLSFLPGIFRVMSLKAPNKEETCMYRISKLLTYI